jgi:hypothetical protein
MYPECPFECVVARRSWGIDAEFHPRGPYLPTEIDVLNQRQQDEEIYIIHFFTPG